MKDTGENIIIDSHNFDLHKLKIKKDFFQSSERPSGTISVNYFNNDNKFTETKFWIKTLENPQPAFEIMSRVFNNLKPYKMNNQMPIPLGYDSKNKFLITSQIHGTSLVIFTLKKSLCE